MDYQKFLKEEYTSRGEQPVYCRFGNEDIIVPVGYLKKSSNKQNGKDCFIDDLMHFQDDEFLKYERYNREHPDNQVEIPETFRVGDIYIFPPLKYTLAGYSNKKIAAKVFKTAERKMKAAVKRTQRAIKEYPDKTFLTSLNKDEQSKLNNLHLKYCAKKIGKGLGKSIKWTAKQTTEIISGAAGALPAAAYYLLDKKVHFSKNKFTNFLDEKALPYIRKGALKALIPLSLVGGIKLMSKDTIFDQKTVEETKVNEARYTITDKASFEKLYQDAFQLMIQSMLPTEVLVCNPYADNGKNINTIGIGSYWYPKSGDPTSSEWIKTRDYLKKVKNFSITGTQAVKMADGWFRYREDGRIFRLMCNKLKGAELTTNEFAAIATCMYNDEANGAALCDFVRENYQKPIKCASYLAALEPKNQEFNDGIKKRHAHEALMYLNVSDYINKMPNFLVKEDINSKGNKYYVTSVTQLNPEECDPMIKDLAAGNIKEAELLANKIFNYYCIEGKTLAEIANKHNLWEQSESTTADYTLTARQMLADSLYQSAMADYNKGSYKKALSGFQKMIDEGFNGADIHNDLAITYYNLGQYKDCIKECQLVLATGEEQHYAHANYNAGLAYERLGNRERAYLNYQNAYQNASSHEPEKKIYEKCMNRTTPVNNKNSARQNTGGR